MSTADASPPKKSKLPLLVGLVLALVLGGGGFYAVRSGLLGGGSDAGGHGPAAEAGHGGETGGGAGGHGEAGPMPAVAFVALQPLLVSLNHTDPPRQLRFEATLEVAPDHAAEVQALMPRIMDVMNSYLRAVEMEDLRDPAALLRFRAQMLRRVQVVTGEGRVEDLLVTSFLVN